MENEIQKDTQKISEAEIMEPERVLEAPKKNRKKRYNFYIELILFFILGILLGIAVKTEAVKKVTIGFDDYKMKIKRQDYDINQLQNNLIQKQIQASQNSDKNDNSSQKNTGHQDNSSKQNN